MSNQAITWAYSQKGLKQGAKFVLVTLANYADDKSECFPGVNTIAADCGMGRSTAIANIAKLEESAMIQRVYRGGDGMGRKSNLYRLACSESFDSKVQNQDGGLSPESGRGAKSRICTTPVQNLDGQSPESVGQSPESGPEPLLNPQYEPPVEPPVIADKAKKALPATKKKSAKKKKPKDSPVTNASWHSYSDAYQSRYGAPPVRNAKRNGQLKQLIDRIGAEESPHVAAYYVQNNSVYYVSRGHSIDCLLADAEKLRTEWFTGRQVTQTQARQLDKTQSNFTAAEEAKALMRQKRQANEQR